MPTLHDLRASFTAGRTGHGLRIREDTDAYRASLFDADNCMVMNDGRARRRWGTFLSHPNLPNAKTRLERWEFTADPQGRYILAFSAGRLDIINALGDLKATFAGQPWTESSIDFLTIANESNKLTISDGTFRTQVVTLRVGDGTFSIAPFAFDLSDDKLRLAAPFYQFADPAMKANVTIFTSAGASTGYGPLIATAAAIPQTDFDLTLGTGKITTDADFFLPTHVGTRMRLSGGEFEVLSVVGPRQATIKVWRDIAEKLDTDPFFIRRNSRIVEVAAFDHGLSVGDRVFFAGLAIVDSQSPQISTILLHAVAFATDGTTVPIPSQGAAGYPVMRVVDPDHFEILGEGTALGNVLVGGSDVLMFRLDGINKIREPAFSDARGWPQASAMHETRLWLGGTDLLPDAIWASRFGQFRNFDPATGEPDDAIAVYGIGNQSRVRHLVSSFDLLVLTDNGEYFMPGSVDAAITQETARALPTGNSGAAFTRPILLDGSVFFVDVAGNHVREMVLEANQIQYNPTPASVVVPDWVKKPDDVTTFAGSQIDDMPYALWVNRGDGSILVMHSRKSDNSFGFMRWTLSGGEFVSVVGLGPRLFAMTKRGADYRLVQFDTIDDEITTDFSEKLTQSPAGNAWISAKYASVALQGQSGRETFTATLGAAGNFVTQDPFETITIGEKMPWLLELNGPIAASGQGSKAGKMRRLVSAEIAWAGAEVGDVNGQPIMEGHDHFDLGPPAALDEWREYFIGEWGREPRLRIEGDTPGKVALRGANLNVYF